MSKLGVGAIIGRLGGNEETVETFTSAIGKTISGLEIVDNKLVFTFVDDSKIALYDDGQSCCEYRYMNIHTDDNLSDFIGTTLVGAEVRDGPEESGEWGDVTESQFLIVTTSLGQFTVVNYNAHNGYYGGFWIICRAVE